METKIVVRDSWRPLLAMAFVVIAMFASVLILDGKRDTLLAEREPVTTIRVFVEE
jgi:hypothetical protein